MAQEKSGKKTKTLPVAEDFDAPPLMEEPQYSGGYIFEGVKDDV